MNERLKQLLVKLGIVIVLAALMFGAVYGMYLLFGPIATILYLVLFMLGLTFIPILIMLLGKNMPAGVGLAKLHIALGQVCYRFGHLVEFEDRYEWLPGKRGAFWYNGSWYEVEGERNYTILGWRPFGLVRWKDDDTYTEYRTDTKAEQAKELTSDGGALERGGYTEADPPIESGQDGWWVLDYKRVFTPGLRKFGDIELIEKAEEVIERGQVSGASSLSGWKPILGALMGLIIGVGTGVLMI